MKFQGNGSRLGGLGMRGALIFVPLLALGGCMSAAMTDIAKTPAVSQLEENTGEDDTELASTLTPDQLTTGTTASSDEGQPVSNEDILQQTVAGQQEPAPDLAAVINEPTQVDAGRVSIFASAQANAIQQTPGKPASLASLFAAPENPATPAETALLKRPQAPATGTARDIEDDGQEEDDDSPSGLMKLVSAPGMARMAANGLWIQTAKVDTHCFKPDLINLIRKVESHYGKPAVVTSGFRDLKHNRKAGGSSFSRHTTCDAADIQVKDVTKWDLAEYLRSLPERGGVGTYCHTKSVHIDTGSKRDWNWRCRRKRAKS